MGNRFQRPLFLFPFFCIALSGFCASEQEPAPDPAYEQRQALANRYVHEILPYWQRRLQLEDWNVFVLLTRPSDLRPGTLGNIRWDREKKSATIRVMDASGYPADPVAMLSDMQVTVVHELVHLELASLPVAEADRSNQEYAVDHLTDALLRNESGPAPAAYSTNPNSTDATH